MDGERSGDTVFAVFCFQSLSRAEIPTCEVQNGDKSCPQNKTLPRQHRPISVEVTLEPEHTEVQLSEPEAPAQSDEDCDVSEEEVTDKKKKKKKEVGSDEDWLPQTVTEELSEVRNRSSEEDSDGELELPDQKTSSERLLNLCTECGHFYWSYLPHICKYKLKPHACNVCGRRYATEVSLRKHSKSHNENLSENLCVYCFSTILTKQHKLAHQQIHQTQLNPYRCRHCSSSFASIVERAKHMKSHRGPFDYKCDICGLSFGRRDPLERHLVVHTGVKPYKCSVCERGFNQEGHLKSHMRLHTGERPYACPHCDKAFNHNVSLKSHLQRYHPSESEATVDNRCDGVLKKRDSQELSETGPDSGDDDVQKQDTEQKRQEMRKKYNRTGRPKGRPKRPAGDRMEDSKVKSSRQNENHSHDHDDDDFTDDDVSFGLEKERRPTLRKKKLRSGKPRGPPRKI